MAATADQIRQLRRMVAETTHVTYANEDIATYIESYPCIDERGQEPYTWDTSTDPPTQEANDAWVPTYDLNAAAAAIWEEKAAALAANYDFTADGGTFNRSQAYQQAQAQARHFHSRRNPRTITARPEPWSPKYDTWRGNLAESD